MLDLSPGGWDWLLYGYLQVLASDVATLFRRAHRYITASQRASPGCHGADPEKEEDLPLPEGE
eukprot:2175789-Prorocentrum_lima.AAC.1